MSKSRITTEVVRAGQSRPYADTEYVVQVTFEFCGQLSKDFQPSYTSKNYALLRLAKINGFVSTPKAERKDHFETYLDYVKPIEPKRASEVIPLGDPDQEVAYIWEFRTVSPFTD
jgi:hypothetical protein